MTETFGPPPQSGLVIQVYGSLAPVRLKLPDVFRGKSVAALNRLLAHTMAMCGLDKKEHWQVSGATYCELHPLFQAPWRTGPSDGHVG